MAKNFLLEIGTEEIPAGFMKTCLEQLKENAKAYLEKQHLPYETIKVLGTPRRLALIITDIANTSADIEERHKGPAVAIAFDNNGVPTKAAIGFAKGKGIEPADLVVEEGYVYAETTVKGQAAKTVLTEMAEELLKSFHFPKSMRWGSLEERFVRPLRWLVAILDGEEDMVLPLSYAGVTAGNITCGHRFLGEREFVISSPSYYEELLEKNYIIVDQDKRREMIKAQIKAIAEMNNAIVAEDEGLLEEIIHLVEYPTALCGRFDEAYLELPMAAVVTPMKDHQRYFPLLDKEGRLMPLFITIRNGNSDFLETVKTGNERVLRARLDDAKFFFSEDRKKTLDQRVDALKRIVFQEGLGDLYDKTQRLFELGAYIGERCGLTSSEMDDLKRATLLAKTDLTTGMVTEFTELQGIIGRDYALLDGEKDEVAEAIYEQYLPRFAGDELPSTKIGKILSMADKMDNIVATFSRGLIPTGSQDPYALRRQTIGILNIMGTSQWRICLEPIIKKAAALLGIGEDNVNGLVASVKEFFLQRLKNIYLDRNLPYEMVALLLSRQHLNLAENEGLIMAMESNPFYKNEELVQAYLRIYNLVKDIPFEGVNISILSEDIEKKLYEQASQALASSEKALNDGKYEEAVSIPGTLVDTIDQFFEEVMVMDKNEKVKNNRLQLLRMTYEVTARIGAIQAVK